MISRSDNYFEMTINSDSSTYSSHMDYLNNKVSVSGIESDMVTPRMTKKRYQSKFANVIFSDLLRELRFRSRALNVALFANNHSVLTGQDKHIIRETFSTYAIDISAGNQTEVRDIKLYTYDIGIIDNLLDHIESTMQRGNTIKEALQCLRIDKSSYLVISSEKIDKEELKFLAFFAGAREIIEPECLKDLEHSCIIVANRPFTKKEDIY